MMGLLLGWAFLWATILKSSTATTTTALNCCEGDLLILLDSSGSILNYEFLRLVHFTADLLRPFSLGPGHVRVGLLQVGTTPILEFGLDVHRDQESLQRSVHGLRQLQGDTNNEAALSVAQSILVDSGLDVPKVLLWLTDGVHPGDVDSLMTKLKLQGVYVLAVSTVHGNFQVLQRAVSPPINSHLYIVDFNSIEIITNDLRDAIIKILSVERLHVVHLTSHSALLQWHPVLLADRGYYVLWYRSSPEADTGIRQYLSGQSSSVELSSLQPETSYTAFLHPQSNDRLFNTLLVQFTTLADVLSPAVVHVSDPSPHELRVSWGPPQPAHVLRYTVEYGTIPHGQVHTVKLHSHLNSALVTGLEPDSEYLITVTALHANGRERAMSVRACTQAEPVPALVDLQLRPVDQQEIQVMWRAHEDGLRGYWLSWGNEHYQSQSAYVPSSSHSTHLTNVAQRGRVCVSPVYGSGRGDGICCTAYYYFFRFL